MQATLNKHRDGSGGILSRCLVEGGGAAVARARHKALIISLGLECVLLAALVLVPLLATGERPRHRQVVVLPPYHGSPFAPDHATPTDRGTSHQTAIKRWPPGVIFQPPKIPNVVVEGEGDQADVAGSGATVLPPGMPDGILPPWGTHGSRNILSPPASVSAGGAQKGLVPRHESVQQALLVHRVEPVYPVIAKLTHLQGTVQLRAIIGKDGAVRELELVSGHPILARAALEAVRQWRYRPTLLNRQPVEVQTHITVIFQLQR